MRTPNIQNLFRLPSRSRVAHLLRTMTSIEWTILETRLEVRDPLLTMEERDALVMHDMNQTLTEDLVQTDEEAPPRFPPRVPHPDS